MFVSTMRSHIDMFRTVSPPYSITRPPFSMPSSPAQEQGDVLRHDTTGEATGPVHAHGVRHLDPDFAGHCHARHLDRAEAGHEAAEGATHARVGIAADREHAGLQQALLRQQHVADAPHVEEPADAELTGEVPGDLEDRGRLRIHRRREVIRAEDDPVRVPDADPQFLESRPDASGSAGIEQQGKVDPAGDDFAGSDAGPDRTPGRGSSR